MRSNGPSMFLAFIAAAALLAGGGRMLAQVADLPLKPGLWEADVTVKSAASNVDSGPEQVCFTAGMTLGEYVAATNHGASGTKCDVTNKVVTAQAISYDTVCTGPHTNAKGHADFHLSDAAHFTGSSHMTTTGSSRGKAMTITVDKTYTAKFVNASCGSVKPMASASNGG